MRGSNRGIRYLDLVGIMAIALLSSQISAQVTISGTVTDADTSNAVENAEVHILAEGVGSYLATTDVNGDYTVELTNVTTPTQLTIEAASPMHAPQRYGGIVETNCYFSCGGGTGQLPVDPADGPIADIDFSLEPGAIMSGAISASSDGSMIEGVPVQVFNDEGAFFSPDFFMVSDNGGNYTTSLALPPGDYHLLAKPQSQNFVAQAWEATSCEWGSCPILETDTVSLQLGSPVSGIDFELDAGAVVEGTIGPSSANRLVSIWNAAGINLTMKFFVFTPQDSEWRFEGLAGGSYYIDYGPIGVTNYLRRIHNGELCGYSACDRASGEALPVPSGSVVTGLEFEMDVGGNITGTVVDAVTGEPPAFNASGTIVGEFRVLSSEGDPAGGGFIQEDGQGDLVFATNRALPPEQYYVRTYMDFSDKGIGYDHPAYQGGFLPGYADAMYGSGVCAGMECDLASAALVEVLEGEDTDIVLELATGSYISGTVTNDQGQPLELTTVKLVNGANELLAATSTDASGSYSFGGFPAGQYYVRTSVAGDTGSAVFLVTEPKRYFDRVHGSPDSCSEELCNPTSGDVLEVDGISDVSDVDIVVEPGAVITGRIVDVLTGLTIPQGRVAVFTEAGTVVGRYKISSASGQYQTTALAPGTYTIVPEISPAFETVGDQSGFNRSGAGMMRAANRSSGHNQGGISVTIGTEDVVTSLQVVDSVINRIFASRFITESR